MASIAKPKTVTYKRARFSTGEHALQDLIRQALGRARAVKTRSEPVNPEEGLTRLINNHRRKQGMVFGNLVTYSPDRHQLILKVQEDADELDLEQIAAPPGADGARSEFLDSILYFGILGNHVVLVQSAALRVRALELHLQWLLQDKLKLLADDVRMVLADQPPKSIERIIKKRPIKRLHLGTDFSVPAKASAEERQTRRLSLDKSFGLDVLRQMVSRSLGGADRLEDVLTDSHLKVVIELEYVRRSTQRDQDLLHDLAVALRHMDGDEVTLDLDRGPTIKGDELKAKGSLAVDTYNGVIDQNDLFQKMRQWLQEQIDTGVVTP